MPTLTPIQERFILHWGEMGTKWGVNRTVAQIHALLYLSEKPLHAEQIAETLGVARSNVSMSMKELLSWGIVRVVHQMGDRRDHFESLKDVWEMFFIILDERREREIDPTVEVLRACLAMTPAKGADEHAVKQIKQMLGFFETATTWYGHLRRLPRAAVVRFLKMGGRLKRFAGAE